MVHERNTFFAKNVFLEKDGLTFKRRGETLDSIVCSGKGAESVASKIAKETHKFWEVLAILGGVFLVFHGAIFLIFLDQVFIFRFFSWAESFIGLATILIDSWFLVHI